MARKKKMNDKKNSKEPLLYRGTNNIDLENRKKQGFYYGIFSSSDEKYFTSTSPDLMYALISGKNRCETLWYVQNKAKPVLIAINPKNYLKSLSPGLESCEILIDEKISFDDIKVIDSLEKLVESYQSPRKEEIEYFKRFYLGK